jgi:branched-chain amino acid transport system substrate-binding protein
MKGGAEMIQAGGKRKRGERVSRRIFLKGALMGIAGCAVGPLIASRGSGAERPIRFGLHGVCSGAGGISGEAALQGIKLWGEEINKKGGLLGREVQIFQRDTFGKPEDAVRYTREFAASGDIDFIIAHGSSAEAFAVAAISKDIKRLITSLNETTEYTADPKVRSPYCFRFARNGLLMGIGFGQYAGRVSKDLGLTRWSTIGADYAMGRDTVNFFVEFLKRINPQVEIKAQVWPKLYEADFSPQITAILAARPQAVYSGLWGGDLIAFIKQAAMYGLFEQTKFFSTHLGDYQIIDSITKAIGRLPVGLYTTARYLRNVPDNKANHDFYDAYVKRFGVHPLHWAWLNYLTALSIEEAVKKTRSLDNELVIRALEDLAIRGPGGVGRDGTVTIRGRDHQLINYAEGCGITISEEPYLTNIVMGSWDKIIEEETLWLKRKGWL